MQSLYLIQSRAAATYACTGCGERIPQGSSHFRHDPHPYARIFRGEETSHWCRKCIEDAGSGEPDKITRRIRLRTRKMVRRTESSQRSLFPLSVEVIGIAPALIERLAADPRLVHSLSPGQFEEFVCDRLYSMGLEPKRVGPVNHKDGGVDILFWPRSKAAFPFLGAAQVKHHRDGRTVEGPGTVRDFAGVMAGHPFNAGLIVCNTSFSPDAEWFAREHAALIRLRGFADVSRWILSQFDDESEWREMPASIELCPGVVINLRG